MDGRADRARRPEPLFRSVRRAARRRARPRLAEGVARDAAAAAELEVDTFLTGLGDELFEPRVHRDLSVLLPGGSTVYVASSMPIRDLETFLPTTGRAAALPREPRRERHRRPVSSGLGAAAVAPGRTFVLTGDVGLYHDMNGLLAASRLGVRGDDRRDEQRRRRDLRLPADRAPSRRLRGAVRDAHRPRPPRRSRTSTACASPACGATATCPARWPRPGSWRSRSTARATSSCTASCSRASPRWSARPEKPG